MGFFKTLFSICSGTEIFPKLIGAPFRRMLLHFILLSLICSFAIFASRLIPVYNVITASCAAIYNEFGNIEIGNNGILPEKNPADARKMFIPDKLEINYFPDSKINNIGKDNEGQQMTPSGIIWTPGILLGWIKMDQNEYIILPLIYAKDKISIPKKSMSMEGIADYITKNFFPSGPFNLERGGIDFHYFKLELYIYTICGIFLLSMLKIVFSSVLFTGIFAVIYALAGKSSGSQIRMKDLFAIGIYTGFPAMIIATLFPAFSLPFLDYQTVFLIAFLTYLFVVFNRIQKSANKNNEKDEDEIYF